MPPRSRLPAVNCGEWFQKKGVTVMISWPLFGNDDCHLFSSEGLIELSKQPLCQLMRAFLSFKITLQILASSSAWVLTSLPHNHTHTHIPMPHPQPAAWWMENSPVSVLCLQRGALLSREAHTKHWFCVLQPAERSRLTRRQNEAD